MKAAQSLNDRLSKTADVVWVCDREADIYEFIDTLRVQDHDFVIRANCNRVIADEEGLLKKRVLSSPILGEQSLEKQAAQGMVSIEVEIRSCELGLVAQRRKGGAKTSRQNRDHELSVVHIQAKDPTYNLEWYLLTSLRVDTLEDCLDL